MIYYSDDTLTIRTLTEADAHAIAAEYNGQIAGYIHVYPDSKWGPLGGRGCPEIVDFGVLEKFRRQGVGARLMDAAEAVAAERSGLVYLAVGLHKFYGPAQRLYARRGYVPDGSGVWYGDKPCEPYEAYRNDDELNLYLIKNLR